MYTTKKVNDVWHMNGPRGSCKIETFSARAIRHQSYLLSYTEVFDLTCYRSSTKLRGEKTIDVLTKEIAVSATESRHETLSSALAAACEWMRKSHAKH